MNDISERTSTGIPSKKILLWIAMGSMIMLFAGLTSAYIVRQAEGNWILFELPFAFKLSTAVLMISSVTMQLSVSAARKRNQPALKRFVLITLLLGLAFVAFQFQGWKELRAENVVFAGKASNPSGSFLYVLTGLHLAHLIGGLLSLVYCLIMASRLTGEITQKNVLSVELSAIFWHFLDLLWIYLFVFLLFVR